MKSFFHLKANITFIVSTLILILVNYLFTGIALLNTFGYEFAAVNGLLLVIISGLFTISKIQKTELNPIKILKDLCNIIFNTSYYHADQFTANNVLFILGWIRFLFFNYTAFFIAWIFLSTFNWFLF